MYLSKINLNLKIIFLTFLVILCSLFPSIKVFADGSTTYTPKSISFENDSTISGTGGKNETQILDAASAGITDDKLYRNQNQLNIKIDELWQFIRWGIGILSVFGTISSFFILSKSFLTLAWIPDHPMQRRKCYTDILTSGLCTIFFAGLSLLMTVFFKTFENFLNKSVMLSQDYKAAFALFLVEYKYLIAGADAVIALTLIVLLIKDITLLGTTSGNPQKRREAISGIMFTIAGIVGCGAVGVIVGIATGLLSI